jgi:hypothetical protein
MEWSITEEKAQCIISIEALLCEDYTGITFCFSRIELHGVFTTNGKYIIIVK